MPCHITHVSLMCHVMLSCKLLKRCWTQVKGLMKKKENLSLNLFWNFAVDLFLPRFSSVSNSKTSFTPLTSFNTCQFLLLLFMNSLLIFYLHSSSSLIHFLFAQSLDSIQIFCSEKKKKKSTVCPFPYLHFSVHVISFVTYVRRIYKSLV